MRVYFHGGPLNGQLREIPDGSDSWDAYVAPMIEMTFKEKEVLAQPIAAQTVTYVQTKDPFIHTKLGLVRREWTDYGIALVPYPIDVFVPRNTVDANGMPGGHRWN